MARPTRRSPPACSSALIPLTTTCKRSTASSASTAASGSSTPCTRTSALGVEGIAQRVAEGDEADHRDTEERTGGNQQVRVLKELLLRIGELDAPRDLRRLEADT